MPRLLSIGGSGFVSGTLARVALDAGWDVTVVSRGKRPVPDGVTALTADRDDSASMAAALEGHGDFDLAVDCIGYEPQDATQDLALFEGRARRFVFISTDFVFDPAHRVFPQPEESEHYLTGAYGGKKRECEKRILAHAGSLPWTIVRPCHIYGPGSLLGCLPTHGRDAQLIERLQAGEPLKLVGGGHFLQQPIFAADLAALILSLPALDATAGRIFQAAGPDIVESRAFYEIVAGILGVSLQVEELPVGDYLTENPASAPFLCHRIYDLSALAATGAAVPSTPLREGLRAHVESLRG